MRGLPPARITVGIDGSDTPETIRELSVLGADEFFAGYVPTEWSDRYGWEVGLNRRTFGPDYQFASLADLGAVVEAAHAADRRLLLTFNAHDYHAAQEPMLRRIVLDACALGPDALIVADPALLELLGTWDVAVPVHLSVGAGCFNSAAVRHFCKIADVRRVVLPRKMSLPEMGTMIAGLADLDLEFEALVIGYRCLFNDEFCFARHSGVSELLCGTFVPEPEAPGYRRLPRNWKDVALEAAQSPDDQFRPGSALDAFCCGADRTVRPASSPTEAAGTAAGLSEPLASALFSNCALCAIPGLRAAGVSVMKIPVRGTGWQRQRYLQVVRRVLDHPSPTPEFCRSLIGSPGFCEKPGSCYYATDESALDRV
jgi:peptidase U32-like protein